MQYLTQAGIKFLQESENLSDKQAGAEAWELMRGKVSGGKGYTLRRAKKEMHKATPKNLSPEKLQLIDQLRKFGISYKYLDEDFITK